MASTATVLVGASMKPFGWVRMLARAALTIGVLYLLRLIKCPWLVLAQLASLSASAIAADVVRKCQLGWVATRAPIIIAWGCSFLFIGSIITGTGSGFTFSPYCAQVVWLVATILIPLEQEPGYAAFYWWKLLAFCWAISGAFIWVADAYLQNLLSPFYLGLAITVALLVAVKFWAPMPVLGLQAVNTAILLIIGLPLADLFIRPSYQVEQHPD